MRGRKMMPAWTRVVGIARMARPTYEPLEGRVRHLEARNGRLEARIAHLERLLEKATRDGKRQAAPLSKGPPKEKPKKPGRKSGTKYGPKAPSRRLSGKLPAHGAQARSYRYPQRSP